MHHHHHHGHHHYVEESNVNHGIPEDNFNPTNHHHHHTGAILAVGAAGAVAVGAAVVGTAAVGVGAYVAHKHYAIHEQEKSHIKLKLRVIRAEHLQPAEHGTSDSFLSIKQGHLHFKTQLVKKDLHPVWNEDFLIGIHGSELEKGGFIEFEVIDKKSIHDVSLGHVTVPLNQIPFNSPLREFSFPLEGGLKHHHQTGRLFVSMSIDDPQRGPSFQQVGFSPQVYQSGTSQPTVVVQDGRGVEVIYSNPQIGYPSPQQYPSGGYQSNPQVVYASQPGPIVYPSQQYPPQQPPYSPQQQYSSGYQSNPQVGYGSQPPVGYPSQQNYSNPQVNYPSQQYPPQQGYPPRY